MSTNRLLLGSLLLCGSMVGCKPIPPASAGLETAPMAAAPTQQKSAKELARELNSLPDTEPPRTPAPAVRQDADALAKATAEYSRAMEIAAAALAKKRAAEAAAQPTDPSATQFNPARRPLDPPVPGVAAPAAAALPGNVPEQVASAGSPAVTPSITQTPPRPEVMLNKDTPGTNTPLLVAQPRPLPATDELAQRFSRQVKDYPQDVAAQFDWQLFQFLQDQRVPQVQTISNLQGEDREMLSAVLDGLTNFRNALRSDNNMLLSRKIRPMLEMADRLRTQAELAIPTVALCTDVKGFGVYEPLEPGRFPADGKEHRVVVYCEVENFASQLDEQKRWETKLTQEVVLYTEQNGLEVWRDKTPIRPIVDYSRNRRHDFFIVKMVRLPANLTIGRYLLKVTVVDQTVNRMAENSVPVQIVAE